MGLMFMATPIYAQSVEPTVEERYVQALQTVINLLQQQVAILVAQLQQISDNQVAITASQTALTNQVAQIAENTKPVFGAIAEILPEPTCALTAEIVNQYGSGVGKITWTTTDAETGGLDSGIVDFTKDFLDHGVPAGNSIVSGYARSLNLSTKYVKRDFQGNLIFTATVYGKGDKTTRATSTCKAIITPQQIEDFNKSSTTESN